MQEINPKKIRNIGIPLVPQNHCLYGTYSVYIEKLKKERGIILPISTFNKSDKKSCIIMKLAILEDVNLF